MSEARGGFESSFGGDSSRITDDERMECGVCWWIYEPERGDDEWQIPPRTPFASLPDHWRCPRCDAAPHQFMVLRRDCLPDTDREKTARSLSIDATSLAEAITSAYAQASEAMRALPVYNDQVGIEVIGPRRCTDGWIGVAITPWCMNLVLLGDEAQHRREGMQREVAFPSGSYRFTVAYLKDLPPVEVCSLFSPMEDFPDTESARAVAHEALRALLMPVGQAPSPNDASTPRRLSRRDLFRAPPGMRAG